MMRSSGLSQTEKLRTNIMGKHEIWQGKITYKLESQDRHHEKDKICQGKVATYSLEGQEQQMSRHKIWQSTAVADFLESKEQIS